MSARLLLVLAGAVLPLPAQIVEGAVTNFVTGAPVSGVEVRIEQAGKTAYQGATDSRGNFRFEEIAPGSYTIDFSKSGFSVPEAAAAARKPFTLGVSGSIRLEARLTPFGKISGHVLDANGEPIAGARLLLNGSRVGLTGTSDSRGQFSFTTAPGRYTLMAKPPEALPPPAADGNERMAWAGTYYPAVTDSRDAAQIVLGAGTELWGQDIRIKAAPLRRVRGVVMGPDRKPAASVQVRAARTDETLLEDIQARSNEDGTFEFPCLYDGDWIVSAQQESGEVKFMAFAAIELRGREPDLLELRLSAPFAIRGRVTVAGAAALAGRTGVFLRPRLIAGSQELSQGLVDDDGNFRIDAVYPGSYKIIASMSGLPVSLTAVRIGGRDILGQYVSLDAGTPPVEILFDTEGGRVRGKVEECGNAVVVLVPLEDVLRDPQFVQTARCGDHGQFEIPNLRPGGYLAFAFDRWEGPLELLARLDRGLINQAVSVQVSRGETAIVDLGVTFRDRR